MPIPIPWSQTQDPWPFPLTMLAGDMENNLRDNFPEFESLLPPGGLRGRLISSKELFRAFLMCLMTGPGFMPTKGPNYIADVLEFIDDSIVPGNRVLAASYGGVQWIADTLDEAMTHARDYFDAILLLYQNGSVVKDNIPLPAMRICSRWFRQDLQPDLPGPPDLPDRYAVNAVGIFLLPAWSIAYY